MTDSRTVKSIKNSSTALIMYFINLFLQFYSRKIFLDYLGAEILGLNTTATNLLQFLNLAEMGISSAVAFSLYKPLHEGNIEEIKELVSLQGHIYKRIALIIIAGAAILMCFFPWIFSKMQLPLWYAYVSFSVLLLGSLLGYFVNYKQVVLSANQQEYKIVLGYKGVMLLKVCVQIFVVWKFKNGFIWWAACEGIFAILGACSIHYLTIKEFPYLKGCNLGLKALRNKYHIIEVKIKQLFFHQISYFALSQISPLVIYAYISLTMVTIYQNYMLIYLGIVSLMGALFNGIRGSIGNVSAENPGRLLIVFKELFSVRFYMATIFCYSIFTLTPYFIRLWIGKEYILPATPVLLISIMLFFTLTRDTVHNYLYVLGCFQDIWAPIAEAIINIAMSVLLGKYFGLNGIIAGVIISQLIIAMLWKPYFLFKHGLHIPVSTYSRLYIKHTILALIGVGLYILIVRILPFSIKVATWYDFLLYSLFHIGLLSVTVLIIMLAFKCEISLFFSRIKRVIFH